MGFAVLATACYSLILTLSPAVRLHSFQVEYRWPHWIGWLAWVALFSLAYRYLNRLFEEHDPYLLPITSLLSGWGLITIFRLDTQLGYRQTVWLGVGVISLILISRYQQVFTWLRRYKYLWLTIGLLLTALTFALGTYPAGEGPRLWLGCCGFYFQPSEPLKLLLVVYLAAYLAERIPFRFRLPELLAPTLIMTGSAALMLVLQRDLGAATLIIGIYTLVIFLAAGRRRILIISGLFLIAAALAGTLVFDVIRLRLEAWLNPWVDPANRSFQIVQSLISVAAGRLLGSGIGLGSPALVPVAHSDFIAAAITEESGLAGILALISLFALLTYRCLAISLAARTSFQRFLSAGIGVYFAIQAILIMGGNLRLLPLTGVTLPFVSYGGSSLVTSFIGIGMLLWVSLPRPEPPLPVQQARAYTWVTALFLGGFAALAVLAGWWSIVRADALLSRPDNIRWMVNLRFVPRGDLFDRRNEMIATTTGERGSLTRQLLYPPLGNTIGYINPRFGKAGLEASLDGYLSGLQGNPASRIWLAELIYSQPPDGLDVRLSLDLGLQRIADGLLENHRGAVVLLNARSGEILVISSHPYYDPNRLDERYSEWLNDPAAPFVNRASQGQYPTATVLGPFLYTYLSEKSSLPVLPLNLSYIHENQPLTCARPPRTPLSLETAIEAGCPAALVEMSRQISTAQMRELFNALGFFAAPDIWLDVAPPSQAAQLTSSRLAAIGKSEVKVTPLQMAQAAATLTNNGSRPSPRLVVSVETPHQGRVILPSGAAVPVFGNQQAVTDALQQLAAPDLPVWQTLSAQQYESTAYTWFIGGTLPQWGGTPLAIAVLLEENNPQLAQTIGETMLQSALQPVSP